MSYGWLTESALIPKPSVPIKVDDSSILDMKMALMKDKQNEKSGLMKAKSYQKKIKVVNKGVEQRNARDLSEAGRDSEQNKLNKAAAILQKKAEIYEKQRLNGISIKSSLVDFQYKQINDMDSDEQQEFNKQKSQFYRERIQENTLIQQSLIQSRPQIGDPQLGFEQNRQELERAQWEEQMIKELESNVHESNIELNVQRGVIEQSYDKKLSQFEKEKLSNVIMEEVEAKEKLSDLKRRRKEVQESRMEKLKKLIQQ